MFITKSILQTDSNLKCFGSFVDEPTIEFRMNLARDMYGFNKLFNKTDLVMYSNQKFF